MAYVTQDDLIGMIPEEEVVRALDDDGDGVVDNDVWLAVAEGVSSDIDGRLGALYSVPFTGTIPALVTLAARILAAEALYARRGIGEDANPWKKQADAIRARLDRVGTGKEPLDRNVAQERPPVVAITEASKTYSSAGNLMS